MALSVSLMGGGFTVYRGACRVVIGLNEPGDGIAFAVVIILESTFNLIPHGAVGIAALYSGLAIEYHPVVCRGSVGKLYARVEEEMFTSKVTLWK